VFSVVNPQLYRLAPAISQPFPGLPPGGAFRPPIGAFVPRVGNGFPG
jgi:hypothetical protein